jgi:hypothetical protein
MTHDDTWNVARSDMVQHHATDEELNGMGEREYAEHVSAHRPSASERFVVVVALLLLGIAGLTVHLGGSMPTGVDTETVSSISQSLPARDFCREHSPYADQSC